MAIFEQPRKSRIILDDTEHVSCIIENWRTVDGHTEFIIRVHRGPFSEQTWRIYKRYNDFYNLHAVLKHSGIIGLVLPPKRYIGNMEPGFIGDRLHALQHYLDTIVMNPILVSSLPARAFIDPANYCQPFGEHALQHVSLALRNEIGWEMIGPLAEIGWRLRKHYYQVRRKTTKDELLASWTDYGPDKHLNERDMHSVFRSLRQLQHPHIEPIHLAVCTEVGGLIVRRYRQEGSLRDVLYGTKPKQSFLKKYGNPKEHKPLQLDQISRYGRQMLLALKFLQDMGMPYGQLHTGNVLIDDDDNVKLLDVENGVLGVASFYRPYFMQHRRISNLHNVDVYCFGHTLYEMCFGVPLQESIANNIPDCAPVLKSVLESILSSNACKSSLPQIDALLKLDFFSAASAAPTDNSQLKFSTGTKEHLTIATYQIEERLRDEQKMVRNQKRLVKMQELMSSEEEKKKKNRQKHRLEHRQLSKDQSRHVPKDELELVESETYAKCDSSISSGTSQGTVTVSSLLSNDVPKSSSNMASPPLPPPPPPLPPPSFVSAQHTDVLSEPADSNVRSALLSAISSFDKGALRKTVKK